MRAVAGSQLGPSVACGMERVRAQTVADSTRTPRPPSRPPFPDPPVVRGRLTRRG